MLEELSIRNYALIENLTISFENGLNIITGETGAGKSIIVGSLSFLLGAKSSADCVRTGADEAGISAVILVTENKIDARAWLKSRDIYLDDNRIIVRRNLKINGRGSIFIQNIPVTRIDLSVFMALLFDIHGQHDHESLMKCDTHRKYIDRFAGIEDDVSEFSRIFLSLAEKRKIIEAAQSSIREREAKIELLLFAVDEINKAALKPGESGELEAEAARLASFEKLAAFVENASLSLFEDSASVLSLSRKARAAIENAANIDSSLSAVERRLSALYFEADDLVSELRSYRDKLSFDPARLEFIEERLAFIYKLRKKYAKNQTEKKINSDLFNDEKRFSSIEEEILAYKDESESEIEALSASDENREKLKLEITALEREIALFAKDLTAKRTAAALEISDKITNALKRLGMPDARFAVRLEPKERQNSAGNSVVLGQYGADDIEFLISANAGEPVKELARIASGGELSRVMLAIKAVLSGADDSSPGTLIFDEIDTGIGGEVAISVGEELKHISARKQVFCVTHIASIACRADNHLLVEKSSGGGRTVTTARKLSGVQRRDEIARLLSGDKGTAALAHADELLMKYSNGV
jgi:DNA repair protein RecN (Recombination protein N)